MIKVEEASGRLHGFEAQLLAELRVLVPTDRQRRSAGTTGRRRRLLRRIAIPLAAVVAIGALAATYVAISRRVPRINPAEAACATTLSSNPDDVGIVSIDPRLGPIATCLQDVFGPMVRSNRMPRPAGLVACTVRGVIYVYPKPAGMSDGPACASIGASLIKEGSFGGVGLAGIQAWYWDVTNQWAQAEEDSTEAGTCLDLGRVTQLVQRSFSAHGLLGWRILVVPRGEHATGDCTDGWSVSFATRTVQVLLMG
jgi:hypothetical protein